ncbi:MAG TPA: efflux RND transporter permease subunit [Bacteroidales bacterium]|nr:efflux RND transporter permease subunit [Bacteroidales bacterium]HPS74197.1 efflux RND transporter permease subunit [Bacteroidales bacterium]
MFRRFIERPVLSTVISIIIVMLGILGLVELPIEQYPDIAPPTVRVSANYSGANADAVLNSVIIPLEEQINGVEGMNYMTSSATNTGSGSINVYFKVGTDPDMAAVEVQNRVSAAAKLLPAEVTRAGVTVRKQQGGMLLMAALYSDNPAFDELFLQNYAEINIIPKLKRVSGVGDASAFGALTYSMRIWLKPDQMAIYGVIPDDITAALNDQSVEASPGKFGERGDQSFQYVIRYTGKLKTAEEFGNVIIKALDDGQFLRLKDVARVELGALSYSSALRVDGKPATNISVSQTSGSNARDVIKESLKVLEEVSKSFPEGVHYVNTVNANKFLDESISKILRTLLEAFLLVFIVVFLFLQDFRSTLIPAISVPVAIVGTFFFLYLFNFSINLLTLFALLLAIGIVVDDAIVVVEAVHAKLDQGYKSARKASIDAMNEISVAIISITLVMASVFIPVTFITGSSGVFYKQFGVTLAIAIILSAINALTLSPALAALFLKPKSKEGPKKGGIYRFYTVFNIGFEASKKKYIQAVSFLSGKKWIVLVAIVVFGGLFVGLMKTTPTGFVPEEDMGTLFVNISLPPASSLERTTMITNQVDSIARSIPEVKSVVRMVGNNMMAGSGSSYGMIILELQNWKDRKGVTNVDVIRKLMMKTSGIRDASIMPFSMPTIMGFGISGGFSFQLQDKGGHTINEFYKVAQQFLVALNQRPEIQQAYTTFNPNFPQYLLTVNVPKVKQAGLTVSSILSTMQGYFAGVYTDNFNQYGKQYRIMLQADAAYRANPEALNKIMVRTGNGQMAPITEFITMTKVYGPESISRFNMFTAISVNGAPNKGYGSGEAMEAIKEVASQTLPQGYGYEFSGVSREEQSSSSQTVYIFLLSVLFVYFLLSALYESYLLPLAVLLSLPVGLSGIFVFAKVFDINNNIYMQISMIMLIGLLAKNAILIVEFAAARRRKGMPIVTAAIEGAKARLRPILMTSLAFIFGIMPLMFSVGAGANGNQSIGFSAVGGMLFGTLFGILVIPVLFIICQTIQEKFKKEKEPEDDDDTPPELITSQH